MLINLDNKKIVIKYIIEFRKRNNSKLLSQAKKKYSFFLGLIHTKDYLISKTSSYNYDSQGRLINEIIILK